MASATDPRYDGLIAGYAALAIVIHILEAGLPSPVPGIKPGLANVVTLIALLRHGWAVAVWVAVLRVLVSALLLGTFMTPTFVLSASGAMLSLAGLGLAQALNLGLGRPVLSAYGLALVAAFLHTQGQFWVAWALFVPHPGLLHLLPVLSAAALLFGLLSGHLASQLELRMRRMESAAARACAPPA